MSRRSNKSRGWLLRGLIAVAAAATAMPVCASATPAASTTPTRIRVVADAHYPPFLFSDADGKPRGYVADMWRLFQAHTGIKVELLPVDWPAVQPDVLSGRADVIGMLYRTPAREALYDFSDPYAEQPVSIYVERRIRGVHDIATLRNYPVGVERGGVCAEKLAALGVQDLRAYADYEGVIAAAVHGDLRIFCMSEDSADHALYREAALDRFGKAFVLFTGEVSAAVRKGNAPMLAAVQQGLARITPAERAQLRKRWLDHSSVMSPYVRAAKLVSAVVALLVALMALWVWMLRRSVARRTRELQEERNKLRMLLDANPDGMWVKDRDGVYLDCNERMATLMGVTRDQLVGRRDEEVLKPGDVALVRKMDEEVMRLGQQRTQVFGSESDDGTVRQVEIVKVPVHAPDGAVRGVLSVSRDITERLQVEAQLQLWVHAFRHAAFGLAIFDARTQCIMTANPVFASERGYSQEEMAGMSVDALYPPELVAGRHAARRATDRLDHSLVETEHVARDGRRFPVLLDISVTHDPDGEARYVIVYAQDISERRRVESELRLAAIAFESQEPMMVFGVDGRIQRVNQAFTRASGYEPSEVIGQQLPMLKSRHPGQAPLQSLLETACERGMWQGERWNMDKSGRYSLMRSTISAVRDKSGEVTHFVYAAVDLTSEREARDNVERLTYFDPLTDLPNRNFLLGRLQQALDGAGANAGTGVSAGVLLMFDLDHFKRVNDLRGHAVGDRLLMLIANRLRDLLQGEQNVLCRFNGGTFALLTAVGSETSATLAEMAGACAERIRRASHEPFHLGDSAPVTITASIGWTELISGQDSPESVLREAELAMYAAKAAGRDQVHRYEPAMHAELAQHTILVDDLRRAIAEDGLDLYFQPQIDRAGGVIGAEALVRWMRAGGELVSPAAFVPLAEQNGLIVPLGSWVLRRACDRLVAWSSQPRGRDLTLAVNVSAREFALPCFVEGVQKILVETGANPARLKLEITESAILDDLADAAAKLSELRSLGIRVSLDDFGTGYSSLAYLARLPLDQLKIDQSFVVRLPADRNDAMVAQSIVGMGRGLGLEVIAEGVETEAQWRFLMDQGCDAFQGYLFGRPVPCADFEAMLVDRPAWMPPEGNQRELRLVGPLVRRRDTPHLDRVTDPG